MMITGNAFDPFLRIGSRLASSVLVSMFALAGLLTIPVSCQCGADVVHGHSLFQLPYHYHGSSDHHADEHPASALDDALAVQCGEPPASAVDSDGDFNPASSNALEHQGGAVVQSPPSSSFGQPFALSLPLIIALPESDVEQLRLPPAPTLEGLDLPPEIPPPKSSPSA